MLAPRLVRIVQGVAAAALAGALLVSAASSQAALPPYWQRVKELEAIVNSAEVADKLGRAPIDQIERPADDLYRVRGGTCTVEVRIVDDAGRREPGWAGPRRFKLDVGKSTCR
ncbi:hypothetical protein [Reyranella sp. CPCC 100927]|uniref:hypothetical protein n=1 Tax=Reyranella sp. CPCC 100927 TaxID=2599616 RepID=UPI0011B38BBD|nr:hypothetical protein [Reyranella sp. CPCC 100927]TWT13720.1 hypothetical protein FQU96_07330 [Reyranella sp. CPCC 100927]